MISQIVYSKDELIELIIQEIQSRDNSNNQHFSNKDELDEIVENFLKQYKVQRYPIFVLAKFQFRYKGFSYKLDEIVYILDKKEVNKIYELFNN